MNKINETLVMMAEQKETFEVNGKKFQVIEVKDAEQQPDYSHLVGKFVRCVERSGVSYSVEKWYLVNKLDTDGMPMFTDNLGEKSSFTHEGTTIHFDLSNPSDTNPDEKKVWEKANEKMWRIDSMASFDLSYATKEFKEQVQKEWKHIRAYLFLSKFADLCNEGRVVDWTDYKNSKYVVGYDTESLYCTNYNTLKRHIAFLDIEARDYSLKVHEQIWKDYWGIEP